MKNIDPSRDKKTEKKNEIEFERNKYDCEVGKR